MWKFLRILGKTFKGFVPLIYQLQEVPIYNPILRMEVALGQWFIYHGLQLRLSSIYVVFLGEVPIDVSVTPICRVGVPFVHMVLEKHSTKPNITCFLSHYWIVRIHMVVKSYTNREICTMLWLYEDITITFMHFHFSLSFSFLCIHTIQLWRLSWVLFNESSIFLINTKEKRKI